MALLFLGSAFAVALLLLADVGLGLNAFGGSLR